MSFAEALCPDISPEDYEQVHHALTAFVQDSLSYDCCRQVLLSTIQHDNPLVSLKEILALPEEPLPLQANLATLEDASTSLRRKTHPWTGTEDQRLLGGIVRFGLDNWQAVAAFVGNGRNRAQCSQRWSRGLNPRISKKGWTPAEDQQLHELVRQYGEKSWAKIAAILGNRSDVQCRYHYRQTCPEDDERLALVRGAKLAVSAVNVFQTIPSNENVPGQQKRLTLKQARLCTSSPMLIAQTDRPREELLLPLSPLADRSHPRFEEHVPSEPMSRTMGGIVVGADPESLSSFLRYFTQ
jgi:hypothetical protein